MSYSSLGFNLPMPSIPDQYWPDAEVGGSATYTFDATAIVTFQGVVDEIISASISTRPSGDVELTPQALLVFMLNGRIYINVILSGGVASRDYIHQLVMTTRSGQILPILIGQVCDPVLAIPPVPPPQSPIFSSPVNWP